MPPRRSALLMLSAALCVATATGRAQSRADAGLSPTLSSIDLIVMNGTHGPGGLDESLRGYLQLTRPPFSAFSRIQEVSRGTYPLSEGVTTRVPLPHGGTVQITPTTSLSASRVSLAVTISVGGRTHQTQFSAVPTVPLSRIHIRRCPPIDD